MKSNLFVSNFCRIYGIPMFFVSQYILTKNLLSKELSIKVNPQSYPGVFITATCHLNLALFSGETGN